MHERLNTKIARLIAARICHDIANPLVSIDYGLHMVCNAHNTSNTDDAALLRTSLEQIKARVRLMQLCATPPDSRKTITAQGIITLLQQAFWGRKIKFRTSIDADLVCPVAGLCVLAVLCLEKALPYGGDIDIAALDNDTAEGRYAITSKSERLHYDDALWQWLESPPTTAIDTTPLAADLNHAIVQFYCLSVLATTRTVREPNGITICIM